MFHLYRTLNNYNTNENKITMKYCPYGKSYRQYRPKITTCTLTKVGTNSDEILSVPRFENISLLLYKVHVLATILLENPFIL